MGTVSKVPMEGTRRRSGVTKSLTVGVKKLAWAIAIDANVWI
jgi:hypothetical protein